MLNPGGEIYERRLQKGWTQAELALKVGIAQANLSNIEKGKRDLTVSTLARIAAALEVKPAELIREREDLADKKKIPLTRRQMESLAQAICFSKAPGSQEISKMADLFRQIRPRAGTRSHSQKIQQAWTRLRERFSSQEIRGIFQRVEDLEQRIHAKKAN